MKKSKFSNKKWLALAGVGIAIAVFAIEPAFAQAPPPGGGGGTASIGDVAANIIKSLKNVASLIGGVSYVAGLAFMIAAIAKFKAHKDQPAQVPVGAPIALVFIAAAFLFLPTILSTIGSTVFGAQKQTAGTSGEGVSDL